VKQALVHEPRPHEEARAHRGGAESPTTAPAASSAASRELPLHDHASRAARADDARRRAGGEHGGSRGG